MDGAALSGLLLRREAPDVKADHRGYRRSCQASGGRRHNKPLCESNAQAEGVSNTEFRQGNALNLVFPDESFDAVTSNYVYHNIPSHDRQEILLETLRVLKKGGVFALHDIFSKARYGDMHAFVQKLRAMGYEQVELIDTTNGMFMSPAEARWMALSGSALLVGRK